MNSLPNKNGSIEFAVMGDACIGKIIQPRILADSTGANAPDSYDEMLAANCKINIPNFSQVTYINSDAWFRFPSLARHLFLKGQRLRLVGLSGQPLKTYNLNKLGTFYPRYANIEDAIHGLQTLNPETENIQSVAIARLTRRKDGEPN